MRVRPPYVRCVRALSWQPGVMIQEIDRSLTRGQHRLFPGQLRRVIGPPSSSRADSRSPGRWKR
jgi:hypothetical protein